MSSQTERSLLKQLTEALYAHFMADLDQASEPGATKISVFLSHAKTDGTTPARGLRDYIYSQTQLAAFYDENDIAFGALFAKTLDDKLESSRTAAMIVVRSAAYFERPWCRRELAMFRRPRKWLEL
ncbi:MAG: toll/interleukin-1 receptor domain-containing protein, partial [bacterium]